mmetsp:Transcript_5339/g.15956  ORF Transcript_5339/g.15956 Transcript_5339/m.15956 type:complete len:637 (-) Transcript_5339:645-2555(-)
MGPLGLSWTPNGRIALSSSSAGKDTSAPFFESDPLQSCLEPVLAMRYQAHLIFTSNMSVLEKSRSYRAAMQECAEALVRDADRSELHISAAETVTEAHKVWSFCEALYIIDESHESTQILLRDWLIDHFDDLDKETTQFLQADEKPSDERFWSLVCRLAAVGRREVATKLVQGRMSQPDPKNLGAAVMGDLSASEILNIAEAALLDAPAESIEVRIDGTFRVWQEECMATRDALNFDNDDRGLGLLLAVLGGSPDAHECTCSTWEETFVAAMNYGRANLSIAGRRKHASQVASAKTLSHPALGAFGDSNPFEGVALLASPGEYFYAAHLADLLQEINALSAYRVQAKENMEVHEYFLSEYALSLEVLRGTLRLAADYLCACGPKGQLMLADMLLRVNVRGASDPTIEKVFTLASMLPKHKQEAINARMCRRVAAQSASAGNHPGAAYWYGRGNDEERAVTQAELALTQAEIAGCSSAEAEVLDRSAEAISVCGNHALQEKLEYVRLYSELQASLIAAEEDENAAHDAATLAATLLGANGGLPEKHWAVVTYDCSFYILPQADGPLNGSRMSMRKEETYTTLQALETVMASKGRLREELLSSLAKRNPTSDPEEILNNVRLKLMRNLVLCAFSTSLD